MSDEKKIPKGWMDLSNTPIDNVSAPRNIDSGLTTEPTKTLRDEFAMAAMPAVIGCFATIPDDLGEYCYTIADAMMEARG